MVKRHRVTDPLGCIRGKREIEETDVSELEIDNLDAQEINFKGHRIEVWRYVNELYDYVSQDGELLIGDPIDRKTLNAINAIERSKSEEAKERITERQSFRNARERIKKEGVVFWFNATGVRWNRTNCDYRWCFW